MIPVIPSTAELLLRADRERPRSRQTELGMSDLGGCRRRAGYALADTPHDESLSGSVQAVMGTAIHEAVTVVLKKMRAEGLLPSDAIIDEPVRFAGVKGHPDLYVAPVLRDTKTQGYQVQVERVRVQGPPRQHRWQVMMYAAALIVAGYPVDAVQLDYIARDSGNTYMWEGQFSMQDVQDALAWLDNVRETPLEWLSRDYAPESLHCKHCPFRARCWSGHAIGRDERSVLLIEDKDAAKWGLLLHDARARKRLAEADEAKAKGALDALRPNDQVGSQAEVAVPGLPWLLRWTVSPDRRLDGDQIRQDYAANGAKPPVNTGRKVKLELVAPRLEDE